MTHVVFVCTGNAARSVMAGAAMARVAPEVTVTTAGTHVVEGQPMSWRTRDALEAIEAPASGHRSRQLKPSDVDDADLVVGLAAEHVAWVRRAHPGAAGRTATLKRLCRDLPGADGTLEERLAQLHLDEVELEPWEDVEDPAGAVAPVFVECAREVLDLVHALAGSLGATG
ncbi:MAG: arsenate reductase/protein-tyrosine-phosphatase family protein [Acidimicrobiales bacterium]